MNAWEEAIADCKYAKSLSQSMLIMHLGIWSESTGISTDVWDREYQLTILEIQRKLGTTECLLEN